MIYIRLFYEFFKTGLFAFGGGLATLPFLYDISARTGWFTTADISDMIAVSESTPGPMGINMSTYVGYHVAGVPGALVATLSLTLPSFLVILIVARMLERFRSNRTVQHVLYGIRPASVAMIMYAGLLVARLAFFDQEKLAQGAYLAALSPKAVILAGVVLFTFLKFKKHPIYYILAAAAAGMIFRF